jgi:tRNA G18 (ribose-2'-O)-methylase SpoU
MTIDAYTTYTPEDLAPYSALKEKALRQSDSDIPHFICEGRYLVEEAIAAAEHGQLQFVSLLCNAKQLDEWKRKIPKTARLLTLETDELNTLVGFNFHRGVLCCCAVPEAPCEAQILNAKRLLVLPQIDNVDNLGQLVRTAAGLGIDAILLGEGPNPFSRRCVRVSMGAVWKIPMLKCRNIEEILTAWCQCCPGIESEIIGTAPMPEAVSAWEWTPAPRTALVLGPESACMDFWQNELMKHVRIPLAGNIDSLNVSAAGAILMGMVAEKNVQFS